MTVSSLCYPPGPLLSHAVSVYWYLVGVGYWGFIERHHMSTHINLALTHPANHQRKDGPCCQSVIVIVTWVDYLMVQGWISQACLAAGFFAEVETGK